MKEKVQAPQTELEQKSTSARSRCNSEVGDDPNEHGTETHREKSKVENSAKSDRRRRQCHKSCDTDHHGQHSRSRYRHSRPSQERRCDTCDSHHYDRDTDRYRARRSFMNRDNASYEPRQRRRQSPSVVRDRYRSRGRRRLSRSHTNSYMILVNPGIGRDVPTMMFVTVIGATSHQNATQHLIMQVPAV